MSDDIQPALTPKEWAEQLAHAVQFSRTSGHGEIASHVYATLADVTDGGPEANGETEAVEIHWNNVERSIQLWDRRKLAALCLHGQPFGFTPADAETLREEARAYQNAAGADTPTARRLRSLADRIAALLPP